MIKKMYARLLCATMFSLCAVSSVSPFVYSTVLNSRARMAYAAALAAEDKAEFKQQMKRVKKFTHENKALSGTAIPGIVFGSFIPCGGTANMNEPEGIAVEGSAAFQTLFAALALGLPQTSVSLNHAIRDEKAAERNLKNLSFVYRLLRCKEFQEEVGIDDPERMHRLVQLMERVGLAVQMATTTLGMYAGFHLGKNSRIYTINPGDKRHANMSIAGMMIGGALPGYIIKPLMMTIWRKVANIPDMVKINKAIARALQDKAEWRAIFEREDAEAADLAKAGAEAPAVVADQMGASTLRTEIPESTETHTEEEL